MTIGQNLIQLLEQLLHLAPPFSLRHLVAHAKLWGSTVVATASRTRRLGGLETGYTGMLHGMVMRGRRQICQESEAVRATPELLRIRSSPTFF